MKTLKTALVLTTSALLGLALFAAPSSAAPGTPDAGGTSGALYVQEPGTTTKITSPFPANKQVTLYANFTGGARTITFYRETAPNSNTWTEINSDEANGTGNAYVSWTVPEGSTRIFAEDEDDLETEIDTIVGTPGPPPPPPGTAVLNNPTNDGKTFTATFNPAANGQSTKLEAREICTYETDETNPELPATFDEDQKQKDCKGPWTTRATGKQNSSGQTTFTISDPLEVEHTYRAVSGSTNSNEIKFAAPLPTNPYGTDTGLSEVHFNTYEGDSVNTRTRNFEGAFSMTASERNASPAGTACAQALDDGKPAIMKSTLKGRGNYSWSFPKKSFTLKTGKKLDLCGLGKSKKYALVANDYDKSLMRNSLAQFVGSKLTNLDWSPKSVPVEFYMNGSYRGSYMLIERIAIQGSVSNNDVPEGEDPDTLSDRVNIHELNGDDPSENTSPGKTGGYILEWDFRAADNDSSAPDRFIDIGTRGLLGVKEPEDDRDREGDNTGEGISSTQLNYIDDYVESCDDKLFGSDFTSDGDSGWKSCIDKASAVDYYIGMEYMKPVDGNMWASVYMYKPREGKLRMGPLWDFDLAAGSANRAGNVVSSQGFYLKNNLGVSAQQTSKTWFNRLNEDPEFRTAVANRWDEVTNSFNVSGFIDDRRALIDKSAAANFKKWPYSNKISDVQVRKGSWSADVTYVRGWASGRKNFLSGSTGF